jgi:iron complex outermembrane receptor protein
MDRNWRFLRGALLASCSFSLLVLPQAVKAAAAAGSPAANDTASVAELVVTAEKRQERLIDVPLTVTAVGSDQLQRQNITTLGDLSRAVPAFGSNGAIRGVSTGGVARSSQGAVAVVLDGVDLGHPTPSGPQLSTLFDIERVEVLSGPQGMLFGTNASAGVVNIITKAPNPTRYEAIGHVDVGDYGYQREQVTLNAPITSDAAFRISLHHAANHGLTRNTVSGKIPENDDVGARARLLWAPTQDLTLNLIADYDRGTANGQRDIAFAIAPTPALQAKLAACGIVASYSNSQNCPLGVTGHPSDDRKWGFSGQVDYDLHAVKLTSITAWRRHIIGDFDYSSKSGDSDFLKDNILDTNLTPEDDMTFSQEFRLTSPTGQKLQYVAGLFYTDTKQHDQILQGGGLGLVPPPLQIGRLNIIHIYDRQYAVFGQAEYHVTDQLSLIAGGRYTNETVKDVSTSPLNLASLGFIGTPAFILAPVNEKVNVENFSWKLGAQYQFTHDIMAYFTATRGYKGPAVNDQASPPIVQAIIQPEIPMNYELGAKGAFLDGRLAATAAIFYNKIKDFQTSVYVPPTAANPVGNFAQGNAPYIISKGIDLELAGRPIDELTFNAGVMYNLAKYSSDTLVPCGPAQTIGVPPCTAAGVMPPVDQLAGVPKWRFLLNGEYAKEIRSNLTGFVQADFTYESSYFAGPAPNPITDVGDHTLLGGRIGVRASDGRWGLSLFGRNLLNKDYSVIVQDVLSGFDGGAGKSYWVSRALKRTWGVTLDAKF